MPMIECLRSLKIPSEAPELDPGRAEQLPARSLGLLGFLPVLPLHANLIDPTGLNVISAWRSGQTGTSRSIRLWLTWFPVPIITYAHLDFIYDGSLK